MKIFRRMWETEQFWGTIDFNSIFFPSMEVNGAPKTAWLQTFFKISPFVFGWTKTFIQVWNYLRVCKWQNFHFWVNYPFNVNTLVDLGCVAPTTTSSVHTIVLKSMICLGPYVILTRNHASNHRLRAVALTTYVCDTVCECSFELWFQKTLNHWNTLITMELMTIITTYITMIWKRTPECYSISQKWVHTSHFCKYFIISFHVTTLKKWHFATM